MKEYTLKITAIDFNSNLEIEIISSLYAYSLGDAKNQTKEALKGFYKVLKIEVKQNKY